MHTRCKTINHISDLAFTLFSLIMQMVQDLVRLMFEEEGEPGQLKNEIGHVFLIDRGTKMTLNNLQYDKGPFTHSVKFRVCFDAKLEYMATNVM